MLCFKVSNKAAHNNQRANVAVSFSPQQKYFDSGDYNMAKAKMKNKQLLTAAPEKTDMQHNMPTPKDLPQRKASLVASKLAG